MKKKNGKIIFEIEDYVVYPAHGVGKITNISEKTIMDSKITLYTIRIINTEMDVLVPEKNMDLVGVRPLLNKKEIAEVFVALQDKPKPVPSSAWNRRHRVYMDKIKTGNLLEIAEVYRDLASLKSKKILSFGEKKMLDTSKVLIATEISIASKKNQKDVEQELTDLFVIKTKDDVEIDI